MDKTIPPLDLSLLLVTYKHSSTNQKYTAQGLIKKKWDWDYRGLLMNLILYHAVTYCDKAVDQMSKQSHLLSSSGRALPLPQSLYSLA